MSSGASMPLDAQRTKLERLLDDRIRFYRLGVRKGTLPLDEAAGKHAECEAIRQTFRWFVANADWIRAEARRRQEAARQQAEIDDLLTTSEAARAVVEAFPDAAITLTAIDPPEAA